MLTGLQLSQQALLLLDAWAEEQQAKREKAAGAGAVAVDEDDIVVDDEEEGGEGGKGKEKEKDPGQAMLERAGVPVLRAAVDKAWRDYSPLRAKLLVQRRQVGRRPVFLEEVGWGGGGGLDGYGVCGMNAHVCV